MKLTIKIKKISIVTLYPSPSQTDDEFDEFLRSFESIIDNISQSELYFEIITDYFNTRSSSWWGNDINNFEGICIESLTSSHSLKQLISEPTHLLPTSSSLTLLSLSNLSWL